jgi:hypothetical protein
MDSPFFCFFSLLTIVKFIDHQQARSEAKLTVSWYLEHIDEQGKNFQAVMSTRAPS